MKIELALNEGSIKLKKNKIRSSLLDSEILMSEAIDKDRKYIILNLHEEISKDHYIVYRKLINERSKGKPIAYLIKKMTDTVGNFSPFNKCFFDCWVYNQIHISLAVR